VNSTTDHRPTGTAVTKESAIVASLHRPSPFNSNPPLRARLIKQLKSAGRTVRERFSVRDRGGRTEDEGMRRVRLALSAAAGVMAILGGGALLSTTPALAAVPAPGWTIESVALPTDFSAADNAACIAQGENQQGLCDAYEIVARNAGAGATDTGPITLEDALPAGLAVHHMILIEEVEGIPSPQNLAPSSCTVVPLRCVVSIELASEADLRWTIQVTVPSGTPQGPLLNPARVVGGGAPLASTTETSTINSGAPAFGIASLGSFASGPDGGSEDQAGGHPYALTTTFALNSAYRISPEGVFAPVSVLDPKEAVADLPVGLVGSAVATPRCTLAQLSSETHCPTDTIIGRIKTEPLSQAQVIGPLYNMVPEAGRPAEFGFYDGIKGSHILYAHIVPGANGYALEVTSSYLPQVTLQSVLVTVFGDPVTRDRTGSTPVAMLTNPSDCSGQPRVTALHLNSWQAPGRLLPDGEPDLSDPAWVSATSEAPPVIGCNRLRFNPTIGAQPEGHQAESPTGIDVSIKVPQSTNPSSLATPPLREAVVALPPGLSVNPSAANGLAACSEGQVGISPTGEPDGADPQCPDASKIGTVEVSTPILANPLEGSIYLARQTENPFGSLLALYIVVDDPATGIIVKIPGRVETSASGRLTAIFEDSPQFPFSELRTHFFGGPRASLKTGALCGTGTTTTQLTPWSAPDSGPAATPSDSFQISQGANGSACASTSSQLPNKPAFEAGTVTPLAGTYSPFVLKLSREDGSQQLGSIETTLPKGLVGRLTGIPYCSDAQIRAAEARSGLGQGASELAAPSCPAASEVGTVDVGAGVGPDPFYVQGHAYLAGPYKGAPLSLAIVTPAIAGPFDLGTVVVRTALYVDETSAQIRAVSDPIPQILHGIPLDVRSIALKMDRPNFTLNPTSCEPSTLTGTATSTLGALAPLSQRFQVGGCKGLEFKPALKLAFSGQTKRTGFPAVKAVLTQPQGQNANVSGATVILPKGMLIANAHISNPCTRVQFNSGKLPGEGCPAKSVLGSAKVWTPLLEAPEEGKVYFRSNGGERELPDLAVALRGQIPLQLVGFIDSVGRKGAEVRRVRSRFMNLPDAPVSRFELKLSGGKKGLLQNSKNLCTAKNLAKFQLTGQNGKTYDAEPAVQVSCGKKSKGKQKPSKSK
jgi:hypothetical protein